MKKCHKYSLIPALGLIQVAVMWLRCDACITATNPSLMANLMTPTPSITRIYDVVSLVRLGFVVTIWMLKYNHMRVACMVYSHAGDLLQKYLRLKIRSIHVNGLVPV